MNNVDVLTERPDAELVAETLAGDREAFAKIVGRYQSLICSLTYSATGDLTRSEDLAQETFIAAWKGLRQLSEPGKLKAWLCGIARNLARNAARKEGREPIADAEEIGTMPDAAGPELSPVERTISNEEQNLMWRTLAEIPETYREPLVLFYREQQSVERVAEALELSEEAVKQRLSRGRRMLSERMAAMVEGTLRQSGPGRAFTYGVLAALPLLGASASAAAVGAAAAQGSAVAKSAGALAVLTAVMGPLAGIFGAWIGIKASLDSARTDRERKEVIRCAVMIVIYIVGFLALLMGVMLPQFWRQNLVLWAVVQIGLWSVYAVGLFAMIVYVIRRLGRIKREESAKLPAAPKRVPFFYESKMRLLGLPLIQVKMGQDEAGRMGKAVGWIAIGDLAVGAIACGGISVGIISMGGAAVGAISLGGVAMGLLALGGLGIGVYVMAGLGVGMVGFGGLIVAWKMAFGGLAIGREIAMGGLAVAEHANDAVARAAVEASAFMQKGKWLAEHGNWIVWLPIVLVIVQSQRARRIKRRATESQSS